MLLAALSAVCVVAAGDSDRAVERLTPLAESVRVADLSAGIDGCDIVVLPSGWAEIGDSSWKKVSPHLPALEAFVRAGGGLLVFQPNPSVQDKLTVEIVGASITFDNWYRSGEPVRAVREHELTTGFDGGLPWPADRITTFDPAWTSLVRGTQSEDVSLLAGEFDCGRAVVDTDNPGLKSSLDGGPSTGRSNHSDAFLRKVLEWLSATRADCTPDT